MRRGELIISLLGQRLQLQSSLFDVVLERPFEFG